MNIDVMLQSTKKRAHRVKVLGRAERKEVVKVEITS